MKKVVLVLIILIGVLVSMLSMNKGYDNENPNVEISCSGNTCTMSFPYEVIDALPDLYSSSSMRPTILDNSIMLVTENTENLEVGDIIYFESGNIKRGHRIIRMEGECYYTKGDNAWIEDRVCVMKEDIKYKIIGVFW